MRLSGVVSASTGGRGKKCQAECGSLWLLAAAAPVYCGNMPLHPGLGIKQKADRETEATPSTGDRQVTTGMPTKNTTTTVNRAIS